jgi:mono/diheme cytochrome c family protein
VLAFDANLKEVTTKPGDAVAKFTFSVTNVSDGEVVITDAKPSCGCTEAKMPSKPWHLAAGSNGVIDVGVNLAGKSGTIFKWVDVMYASNAQQRLNLKVIMPEDARMARTRNQDMAKNDRQAVFKGDCAKCHAEKTHGKMGKELYMEACDICHGANPRATMVPDLHALNHSTDLNFWKVWISEGKAGSLMPAFSTKQGGPLTDEQIDSLAEVMLRSFPPNVRQVPGKSAAINPATSAPAPPAQKN